MEEARHDSTVTTVKCVTVIADGTEISTPRQLANMLGGVEALVWNHHKNHMDWCLCAIDVPSSLRGCGMRWRDQGAKLLIERTTENHV